MRPTRKDAPVVLESSTGTAANERTAKSGSTAVPRASKLNGLSSNELCKLVAGIAAVSKSRGLGRSARATAGKTGGGGVTTRTPADVESTWRICFADVVHFGFSAILAG